MRAGDRGDGGDACLWWRWRFYTLAATKAVAALQVWRWERRRDARLVAAAGGRDLTFVRGVGFAFFVGPTAGHVCFPHIMRKGP